VIDNKPRARRTAPANAVPASGAVAKALIGVACLAALASCAMPGAQEFQPAAADVLKTNKVEISRLSHTVHFAAGSTTLAAAETSHLLGFLDDSDIVYGDHLYLAMPGEDAVSQKREAAIRRLLAKRGVLMSVSPGATPINVSLGTGDEMTVTLERYVVTPPSCPNWSKPAGSDPDNTVFSNFGCATETNLGMMVAEPRDLLVGRQPGPADADPSLHAMQNYRAGKPIVLPDDQTGQATPAASGAAAGPSAAGNASGGS
jgi:pilus assembly protein CpaD